MEDGLLVTGIGMGVVVSVLVLLMFTIQGLGLFDRIVQRRQTAVAVLDAPSLATAIPELPASEVTARGEIVAAIAVALALAEDESQVKHVLNNPPSGTSPNAWAQAGQRHLMNQRGRPLR
ncbi:MAG: OadG family transporter subunit [Dehalococcoidia bacterium]|nr:OadG family transporter subunit [Dehalococcoidia bacterium]